ncbi:MAG: hypothetical protein ABID84_00705 [Chloroflexota bacterium]
MIVAQAKIEKGIAWFIIGLVAIQGYASEAAQAFRFDLTWEDWRPVMRLTLPEGLYLGLALLCMLISLLYVLYGLRPQLLNGVMHRIELSLKGAYWLGITAAFAITWLQEFSNLIGNRLHPIWVGYLVFYLGFALYIVLIYSLVASCLSISTPSGDRAIGKRA